MCFHDVVKNTRFKLHMQCEIRTIMACRGFVDGFREFVGTGSGLIVHVMFYYHAWELNVSRQKHQNIGLERNSLNWPPVSAAEMIAWQQMVGTDLEIARHLGLSRASIYGQRMKFGIPALPRKKRARVRERQPGPRKTKREIARLYAGRRYEDQTSAPPLRGPMPPGFGLRELPANPYLVAAE